MKTLTSTLFQPFAAAEHPVRYFVLIFLMGLGIVHLASDLSTAFLNGIFTAGPKMTLIVFMLTLLISVSRYYEQKKERKQSTQGIAA